MERREGGSPRRLPQAAEYFAILAVCCQNFRIDEILPVLHFKRAHSSGRQGGGNATGSLWYRRQGAAHKVEQAPQFASRCPLVGNGVHPLIWDAGGGHAAPAAWNLRERSRDACRTGRGACAPTPSTGGRVIRHLGENFPKLTPTENAARIWV